MMNKKRFGAFYYFCRLTEEIGRFFSTIVCRILARLHGVSLGKSCSFAGVVKFRTLSPGGITIGKNCRFISSATGNLIGLNHTCIIAQLSPTAQIAIGDDCGFSGTSICAEKEIRIGRSCRIGANSLLTDTDWHSDDPRAGEAKPVILRDHVWIGTNVIVLKGVEIGENTIVGAGSVVTKSLPPDCVAAGNPARVIRRQIPEERRSQ